jgi:hypothetical protein
MPKRKIASPQEVAAAAITMQSRESRAKAADYREAILILRLKSFSQERIAAFLSAEGVKISQPAVSTYLRKHPPTEAEVARIKEMLAAQPAMRCDPEPGREIRQLPAPHKSSQQQDAETPEEAASRKRREELLARARKNCPPPATQPEEEDTTDYSFLDVKNRPFRIRPK